MSGSSSHSLAMVEGTGRGTLIGANGRFLITGLKGTSVTLRTAQG